VNAACNSLQQISSFLITAALMYVLCAYFVQPRITAFLAVDPKTEFHPPSGSIEAQSRTLSRRDCQLKKRRLVSYDSLIQHVAGDEDRFQEQRTEVWMF
jgi:hypothetical protein